MALNDGDLAKYDAASNKLVSAGPSSGFTQMSGSADKSALAPYTSQTLNTLVLVTVVAQLQTMNNYLVTLSQRMKAHEDALFAAKLISA